MIINYSGNLEDIMLFYTINTKKMNFFFCETKCYSFLWNERRITPLYKKVSFVKFTNPPFFLQKDFHLQKINKN